MEWNETLFRVGAGERGRVGVLVCHGFGGSPRSVQEVALRLAEVGYTVALPLLTGHGLNPEAMEKSRWIEWTADVERAFIWLKERSGAIFLFGLSMGGTLVLWLAERHPDVAGLITVNPVVRHPRERSMRILGRIGLPRWARAIGNDAKKPGVDEEAYDRIPVRATRQLALLLAAVRRDLSLVRCPALIFSSVTDHVVPPDNRREIYESISSADKTLSELVDSYHVATMDNEKNSVLALTLDFIAAHSES
nr:putative esterase/lipase [uncultured bacterium]